MLRWLPGLRRGGDEESALAKEIDRLRQENMRLRLERQRPTSVAAVVAELRARTEALGVEGGSDEAEHIRAEVESARRAVLDALESLIVAAEQTKRQLTLASSPMEIDRRVTDRRGAGATPAGEPLGHVEVRNAERRVHPRGEHGEVEDEEILPIPSPRVDAAAGNVLNGASAS